ncbi:MAG: permease, partial [Planctomycetes bacterium]|nr:permease [Planctomycetota bacterium]
MSKELKTLSALAVLFAFFYVVPFSHPNVSAAIFEAFRLL